MDHKKRAYHIFTALQKKYPQAKIILTYSNPFELLVAVILSAQCTDLKVNEVTAQLFPKMRNLKLKIENFKLKIRTVTPDLQEIINFASIPLDKLEQDIKPTGFYKNKAKSLKNAAKKLLEEYSGIVPHTIEELITLPGVGRKTANVVLGNAYGIIEGIAVDTHVKKQSLRFGFTTHEDPDKIEQNLMNLFDKKDWLKLTYLLIEHGRAMRFQKDPEYEKTILKSIPI